MLVRRSARRARRRGMTIVESALVLVIFLMLLFGLFEYCRFLLVLHVTNNASRDGARYAVINGTRPATFDKTDFTDAGGTTYPSVIKYTTARMGGVDKQLQGFQVAVYPVDAAGLLLTPPVVRSKTLSTATPTPVYPDPFSPTLSSDPNWPGWNAAAFPDRLAVQIKGNYQPIGASFLMMPSTIPVNVTSMMGME